MKIRKTAGWTRNGWRSLIPHIVHLYWHPYGYRHPKGKWGIGIGNYCFYW